MRYLNKTSIQKRNWISTGFTGRSQFFNEPPRFETVDLNGKSETFVPTNIFVEISYRDSCVIHYSGNRQIIVPPIILFIVLPFNVKQIE
jgi:hypothetical protein